MFVATSWTGNHPGLRHPDVSVRAQVIDGEMYIAGEFQGFMEFNKMTKVSTVWTPFTFVPRQISTKTCSTVLPRKGSASQKARSLCVKHSTDVPFVPWEVLLLDIKRMEMTAPAILLQLWILEIAKRFQLPDLDLVLTTSDGCPPIEGFTGNWTKCDREVCFPFAIMILSLSLCLG